MQFSVRAKGWTQALSDLRKRARLAALSALDGAGRLEPFTRLDLAFVDDRAIAALNKTYRGKSGPTNVLSFPAGPQVVGPGQARPLGDVVLALETCEREAQAQSKALGDHVCHLIIHGVLHLLGYDHEREDEAHAMEALEITVLAGLGIANPYRSVPQARRAAR